MRRGEQWAGTYARATAPPSPSAATHACTSVLQARPAPPPHPTLPPSAFKEGPQQLGAMFPQQMGATAAAPPGPGPTLRLRRSRMPASRCSYSTREGRARCPRSTSRRYCASALCCCRSARSAGVDSACGKAADQGLLAGQTRPGCGPAARVLERPLPPVWGGGGGRCGCKRQGSAPVSPLLARSPVTTHAARARVPSVRSAPA